jgi:hypothetical protein
MLKGRTEANEDPEIVIRARAAFAKALSGIPTWAVLRAFDEWERTQEWRPTPAEIRALAERAMKPMHDELARRRAALPPPDPAPRVTPDAAARIMAEAGFNPAAFAPKRMEGA